MKKTLRFMFAAALMMCGTTAFAEDVIWWEDWSGVTEFNIDPSTFNDNYSFTGTVLNDDGTAKSGTKFFNEKLAGGEAPELLLAKNGGSFTAKVALNGKSGEMTLAFKCNKNTIEVTATGATVGDVDATGNDYLYPVTVAAGTKEVSFTFTQKGSANARIDNFKLFQGTAKKPAGLSWGKASTTLTIGEEVTLVLSNENNLPVTYTSSDEAVATISAQGAITLVAAGKTTLTAAFAGNDEYEAQSVSIEVTVKEAGGQEQPGDEIKKVTVAEFIAAEVSNTVWYQLTGTIKNLTNTAYGNFDLEDETGSVYVYGVLSEKGGEKKQFEALMAEKGIKEGSKITIIGNRSAHNDKAEVTNAYFVSVENGTSTAIMQPTQKAAQGDIFNLQGQRVEKAVKGLYIIGGKKMLVK